MVVFHNIKKYIFGLGIFLIFYNSALANSKPVIVMGYDFPPYVQTDPLSGITIEFIKLLNESQNDYSFTFRLTSANRRYNDFKNAKSDMILFEMPEWGWENSGIDYAASREISHGGEVYITQKKPGRGQEYFDSIKDKEISAIMGYHYGFADYNADQNWLYKNFKIHLGTDHAASIKLVEAGRVDISIVTRSYLSQYLANNPQSIGRILISDRYDQQYHLRALIREGATIKLSDFESYIDALSKSGKLKKFQQQHNIYSH